MAGQSVVESSTVDFPVSAALLQRIRGEYSEMPGLRLTVAQAQRLWWYLLVAGGLLLAAETMISNRLSQNGARVS